MIAPGMFFARLEWSTTGVTRSRHALLVPSNRVWRKEGKLLSLSASLVSCAICARDSTGRPITSVDALPDSLQKALFAWTTTNGGVESATSLRQRPNKYQT